MADTVRELFNHKFTVAEIQAGTRHDFTTDANTAYVIKDIETNQGSSTSSIAGTISAGTTADLRAGKFSQLGEFGGGVDSLSGSAILDVSSTLSIRPTATSIAFKDIILSVDNSQGNSGSAGPVIDIVEPTVNGVVDTALKTQTTQTATSPGSTPGSFTGDTSEFSIVHTNANGIKLYMRCIRGTNSVGQTYVIGYDNSTDYTNFSQTYSAPCWDGERYFFWYDTNYIYFYDTDDADLNPTTHSRTCHGRIATNMTHYAGTTYDHRNCDLHKSIHDGKWYFYQYTSGSQLGQIYELPETIEDGGSCPNYYFTSQGGYVSNMKDVYGNNAGSAWNQYYFNGQTSMNQYNQQRLTTFTDLEGTKMWAIVQRNNATYIGMFVWPDSNLQETANGFCLNSHPDNTQGDGVACLSQQSAGDASKLNFNSAYYTWSSNNMLLALGGSELGTGNASWQAGSYGGMYFDGLTMYYSNVSSNYNVFKIDLTQTSFSGLFTDGQYYGYRGSFFMIGATPSDAVIASRNYSVAPGLTVRCTGVKEER